MTQVRRTRGRGTRDEGGRMKRHEMMEMEMAMEMAACGPLSNKDTYSDSDSIDNRGSNGSE
jgi:hypothetical protein